MASTNTCTNRRWRGYAIISRKVSQYETHVNRRYQRTHRTITLRGNDGG
jgi:hypothetical protein